MSSVSGMDHNFFVMQQLNGWNNLSSLITMQLRNERSTIAVDCIFYAPCLFFMQELQVQIVKKNETKKFTLLPKGWIVERTFAWLDTTDATQKIMNVLPNPARQ